MNRRNFVTAALGLGLVAAAPAVGMAGLLRGRKNRGGCHKRLRIRGGRCGGGSCSLSQTVKEEFNVVMTEFEEKWLADIEFRKESGELSYHILMEGSTPNGGYFYFEKMS